MLRLWVTFSALFVLGVSISSYRTIREEFTAATRPRDSFAIIAKKFGGEMLLPIDCLEARGDTTTDYSIDSGHCWYTVGKFRALYPEYKWGDYQRECFAQIDEYLLATPVPGADLVFCPASNLFRRTFTMKSATVFEPDDRYLRADSGTPIGSAASEGLAAVLLAYYATERRPSSWRSQGVIWFQLACTGDATKVQPIRLSFRREPERPAEGFS